MLLALIVSLFVGLIAYWAGGYSVWAFLAGGWLVGMAGILHLNGRKVDHAQALAPLPTRPAFEFIATALGGLFLVVGTILLISAAVDPQGGSLRLGLDMLFAAWPFILAIKTARKAKPAPLVESEVGKT